MYNKTTSEHLSLVRHVAHWRKPSSCYVNSQWVFTAHSKIDYFICLLQHMDLIPGEYAAAYKQIELKCIYFALNGCAITCLNVPPRVFYLFIYFYVLLWENEARRQIMVKQRWRHGILLPKSPQIHLKDIWRTITTCAGTDGKHHSDLMGEDAFYSVIKHFCLSAPQLLQWWPALRRWTREKNSEDMSQEKRACRA